MKDAKDVKEGKDKKGHKPQKSEDMAASRGSEGNSPSGSTKVDSLPLLSMHRHGDLTTLIGQRPFA